MLKKKLILNHKIVFVPYIDDKIYIFIYIRYENIGGVD